MNSPARFCPSRRRFLGHAAAGTLAWASPPLLAAAAAPLTLNAAAARARLGDGLEVPVLAYNRSVPGPEIRVIKGSELRVRLENGLDADTTIHWHGMRIDNAMDGVPGVTQEPVAPGTAYDYVFTPPDAGTWWYHSHRFSSEQVGRGLYGLLVVEEPSPYPVDRELSLVVDDWRLNDLGEIDPSFDNLHDMSHGGRLGNWVTVNGASLPDIPVSAGERLRVRLVNTANARIVTLRLRDHTPWVIALDGQPVPPLRLDPARITLAPGQRADLVVDVNADAPGVRVPLDLVDDRGVLTIAHLVTGEATHPPRHDPPPPLPENPLNKDIDTAGAHRTELTMAGGAMGTLRSAFYDGREMSLRELVGHGMAWSMNGAAGMTDSPLFTVPRGRTVFLDVTNDNRWPHALHIHGHHFRVVERGGKPLPYSPWRDTTLMFGFDRSRLAFVADNPGRWLIHCHMLEHSAGGMMTWFEVT